MHSIIKEEVDKVFSEGIENLPIFNDPLKAAEYAMQWQEKATNLNIFYWQVEAIITSQLSPQDKITRISTLLPNYGWV